MEKRTTSFRPKIAGAYLDSGSVTDVKVFAGRSHYVCGEPGWEEVAEWIGRQ